MENDNDMKMKLDFFLSKKIAVHIQKKNNEFLNGVICGKEDENVYVIAERKFGLMHVFVTDIFSIEEFREVGK